MRLIEMTIIGIILIVLVCRSVPNLKKKAFLIYPVYLAGVLILIHLVVEGYRWQMIPIFIFTLGLILESLIKLFHRTKKESFISNKIIRKFWNAFLFLLFILSVIFPLLLPVVNLPKPSGPYPVGSTSFRMIDNERKEIFTENPDDYRNLLVTTWYPAEIDKRMSVSSYWDKKDITGKTYSINADIATYWYTHLSLVKTNSHKEAPLSSDKKSFPVIIYSPSFYGLNTENTMLMEELASRGYIVFSIAHSFETIVSVYPDDEFIPGNLDHISKLYDSNADIEKQLYLDYANSNDIKDKIELTKQILVVDELSTQLVKTRTEDAIFVLNEIEQLNSKQGLFKAKLDLNQIGIIGWSFGGATVEEVCIADNRVKAGINIDGWPYGELFSSDKTITLPFMLIRSEAKDEMEDIISNLVCDKNEKLTYILNIENASHMNFWDFPLFFRIYKFFGYWGPIDPLRLLEIESVYIVGFFDQNLKGKNVDILDETYNLFPEVTIMVK